MGIKWLDTGTVAIRLGREHIAFLRGYFNGVDLAKLAEKYMPSSESGTDLRVVKSHLNWIRYQVVTTLTRNGGFPHAARLIKSDPEEQVGAIHQMSLEDFAAERDPFQMYRESELLELFAEEYGSPITQASSKKDRLRKRQLRAIDAVERLLVTYPNPNDGVEVWLHSSLARWLKASEICSLQDLVEQINNKGYRWWKTVPRLGEKSALHIVHWLRSEHVGRHLGLSLRAHAVIKNKHLDTTALLAQREKVTGIVPLECFIVPSELQQEPRFRNNHPTPIPINDLAAIKSWLTRYPTNSNTWRSYRTEIERFYLWSALLCRKNFDSLTANDYEQYSDFLRSVASYPEWVGPRHAERWTQAWRPFAGPLSMKSQCHALDVVRSIWNWLLAIGYLQNHRFRPK
jgi:hypothetical protein